MAVVALFVHNTQADATERGRDLAQWLDQEGHDVRVPDDDAARVDLDMFAWPHEKLVDDLDLAISLGGDGSMLRVVGLVADAGVPVLGINFGQLGYLAHVEPDDSHEAIRRWSEGDVLIEQRMRLAVVVERADGRSEPEVRGLNEAVVEKIENGRTVHLSASIGTELFLTYAADGLIAATPTGSTAYSLSARGPVVDPAHDAIIFTPVAPHMLFDRSLVLGPERELRLEVIRDRAAALAIDGVTITTLEPGDAVRCRRADQPAQLVVTEPNAFHRTLKTKFGLSDR